MPRRESDEPSVVPATTPSGGLDSFAYDDDDSTVALESNIPIAPSVAQETRERTYSDEDDSGVPADFGTEGFDEPLSDISVAPSVSAELDLGLDLVRMETSGTGRVSPFSSGVSGGGSLEQVASPFGESGEFGIDMVGRVPESFGDQVDETRIESDWPGAMEEQDQTVEHADVRTAVGMPSNADHGLDDNATSDELIAPSVEFARQNLDAAQVEDEDQMDSMTPMRDAFDSGDEDEPLDGIGDLDASSLLASEHSVEADSNEVAESLKDPAAIGRLEDVNLPDTAESQSNLDEVWEPSANALPESAIMSEESEDSFANEIGDAFDAVIDESKAEANPFDELVSQTENSLSPPVDSDESPGLETRIYDDDAEKKIDEEWARAQASGAGSTDLEPVPEEKEWYLAVDEEQIGPLTLTEVQEKLADSTATNNSLCWKPGMADWIAIRFVKELGSMGSAEPFKIDKVGSTDLYPKNAEAQSFLSHEDDPFGDDDFDSATNSLETPEQADDDDSDEISWEPKGGDLLASLVASEEAHVSDAPEMGLPSDISLLRADSDREAKTRNASALFGVNEVSTANINRPLPRASQVSGTLGLRDSAPKKAANTNLIAASIIAAGMVGAMALYVMTQKQSRPDPVSPPGQMAVKNNPAKLAAKSERPRTAGIIPDTAPPAVEKAAAEPEAAVAVPGSKNTLAVGKNKVPDTNQKPARVNKASAGATKAPATKAERSQVKKKPKSSEEKPSRRAKTSGSGLPTLPQPGSGATTAQATRAPPPPMPRRRSAKPSDFSKDDLLGGAGRSEKRGLPKSLDEAQLLKVILKHKKVIRDCKKKQKAADPSLGGIMQVRLLIKKTGKTSQVTISPPKFASSVVGSCVGRSVKSWVFPKFSGPTIPLDFPVKVRSSR